MYYSTNLPPQWVIAKCQLMVDKLRLELNKNTFTIDRMQIGT
jgi:hypothetical protein